MLKTLTTFEFFAENSLPLSVFEYAHYCNDEKLHVHEFCELVIVKSGSALHTINAKQYNVKTGDVFIIPKGFSHKYTKVSNLLLTNVLYDPVALPLPVLDMNDFVFYNIMFRSKHKFQDSDSDLLFSLNDKQIEEISKLTLNIADQRNSHECGRQFGSIASFMQMVFLLSKWYGKEQNKPKSYYNIGKVLEYLNNHYLGNIEIDKMARLCGMSRRTMFRHFVKATGYTPAVYLCRLRIRHAADLLVHTSLPIKKIALLCCFCDSNYFSKQFRRIMNTSPLRYRRHRPNITEML